MRKQKPITLVLAEEPAGSRDQASLDILFRTKCHLACLTFLRFTSGAPAAVPT